MVEIKDSSLDKWKVAFAKDGVAYKTDDEYHEAISNLVGFIEILIEIDRVPVSSHSSKDDKEMYVYDKDGNKVLL